VQIEITGESEKLVLSALTSGEYASAEEFLAVILCRVAANVKTEAKENPRLDLDQMPEHIDIEELATTQGVGPVDDFRKLKADFWPAEESVDDFLDGVWTHRKQDSAGTR